MGKDITVNGQTYLGAEGVDIPLANGGGDARFIDPSGATLTSGSQMLDGVRSFNASGDMVSGNIPSRSGSDLSASGATVTVPAGHYASQATKSVSSGSTTAPASISGTSASVSTGTNTLTLSKTISVTPNVSEGYISGGTAGNSNVSLTANVTTKALDTITPTTTDQEIPAGTYLTGKQTIKGDTNLKGENIVAGKTIFNVNGTAQIPNITYDTTTHILSIS